MSRALTILMLVATMATVPGFKAQPPGESGEILAGFVDESHAPPGAEHLFGTVYLVRARNVNVALENWSSKSGVRFAEPNGTVELQGDPSWGGPNDNGFGVQWALHNNNDHDIDYLEAWNIYDGPASVVIAILDTGLYVEHQDRPNLWVNEGEIAKNGVDDDGNGYVDDYHGANTADRAGQGSDNVLADLHGHGTHVSGIAAAKTNNWLGIAGVYPNGPIMVVKVFPGDSDSTNWDTIIRGIVYAADNGAKIISMSLGGGEGSQAVQEAVQYAWGKGCLIVAAAGNTGSEGILYPAAHPEVIAVGATNALDGRAGFSTYGEGLEVMAPGTNIWSSAPPWAHCWMGNPDNPDNQYCKMSGTSMATPHVAGVAALIWSKFRRFSNQEVRDRLIQTTDDIGNTAGWDKQTGWGRANAFKAISPDSPNFVRNPSFERGLRLWKKINFDRNDKVVRGAFTGEYSLRLANTPGKVVKAWQRIKVEGKKGDIIFVGAHSNYGSFCEGKYPLRVTVIYKDGTKERAVAWFRRREADVGKWVYAGVSIVAQRRYEAVAIALVNKGKWKMPVKFDEVTLHIWNED